MPQRRRARRARVCHRAGTEAVTVGAGVNGVAGLCCSPRATPATSHPIARRPATVSTQHATRLAAPPWRARAERHARRTRSDGAEGKGGADVEGNEGGESSVIGPGGNRRHRRRWREGASAAAGRAAEAAGRCGSSYVQRVGHHKVASEAVAVGVDVHGRAAREAAEYGARVERRAARAHAEARRARLEDQQPEYARERVVSVSG